MKAKFRHSHTHPADPGVLIAQTDKADIWLHLPSSGPAYLAYQWDNGGGCLSHRVDLLGEAKHDHPYPPDGVLAGTHPAARAALKRLLLVR